MSVVTRVYVESSRVPTIAAWQTAIDAFGCGVVLSTDWDLLSDTGFWPATLHGRVSGFECYVDPEPEGSRDLQVSFRTGSRIDELVCALWAVCALIIIADGIGRSDEAGGFVTLDELLAEVRSI